MNELDHLGEKLAAAKKTKQQELAARGGPSTTQAGLLTKADRDINSFRNDARDALTGLAEKKMIIERYTRRADGIIAEIKAI